MIRWTAFRDKTVKRMIRSTIVLGETVKRMIRSTVFQARLVKRMTPDSSNDHFDAAFDIHPVPIIEQLVAIELWPRLHRITEAKRQLLSISSSNACMSFKISCWVIAHPPRCHIVLGQDRSTGVWSHPISWIAPDDST